MGGLSATQTFVLEIVNINDPPRFSSTPPTAATEDVLYSYSVITTVDPDANDTLTIESSFDNETGNILFRADFANPDRLLRHGQTGTLWIHRPLKNAIVIPQRATFEILDKQYVYVVGDDGVAHQRAITIFQEMDDIFVVQSGLALNDKIVLEGVRQTREGQHAEVEFRKPEEALANLKKHAE